MSDTKLQIRNSTAEFLIFTAQTGAKSIEVRLDEGMIWLSQKLIAQLFEVSVPTINYHLNSLYEQNELSRTRTVRNFLIVQTEGNRSISREVEHYNLDAIISVGYRVNSARLDKARQRSLPSLRSGDWRRWQAAQPNG